MKRIVFPGGVLVVGLFTMALVNAIYAESVTAPKPDLKVLNAMDACQNPQTKAAQKCITVVTLEGEGKCLGHTVNVCSASLGATLNPEAAAACPQCTNGYCSCSKVTQEKPYGRCQDVDASTGYAGDECVNCDFLVCALGIGFADCDDCNNNAFPCSASIAGFNANSCKP